MREMLLVRVCNPVVVAVSKNLAIFQKFQVYVE